MSSLDGAHKPAHTLALGWAMTVGQNAKPTALRLGITAAPSRWRDAMPLMLRPVTSSVPLPMMFRSLVTPAKSRVFGPPGTAQARREHKGGRLSYVIRKISFRG